MVLFKLRFRRRVVLIQRINKVLNPFTKFLHMKV